MSLYCVTVQRVARDAVQTFLLRLLVQFVLLLQHREHAKLAQDVQVRHCGLGEVEDRGQDGEPRAALAHVDRRRERALRGEAEAREHPHQRSQVKGVDADNLVLA